MRAEEATIDYFVGHGSFVGGQLEFDLPKSITLSRATEDAHDIVVDLAEDAIAVIVEQQTLPSGLELDKLFERITPDDPPDHLYDTSRDRCCGSPTRTLRSALELTLG